MSARPSRAYSASALYLGNGVHSHGQPHRRYRMGSVPTVHGYVAVYSEGFDAEAEGRPYASWRFIHDGQQHELVHRNHAPTERGLVRIARQFAEAVVNGWPLP